MDGALDRGRRVGHNQAGRQKGGLWQGCRLRNDKGLSNKQSRDLGGVQDALRTANDMQESSSVWCVYRVLGKLLGNLCGEC